MFSNHVVCVLTEAVGRITDIISNTCRQTNTVVDINTIRPLEPQMVDVRPHGPAPGLQMSTQPSGVNITYIFLLLNYFGESVNNIFKFDLFT